MREKSASRSELGPVQGAATDRGSHGRPLRHLFGLDFDDLTQSGLVDRIAEAVSQRKPCWIATLNVNLLCLAHRDPDFAEVLRRADVRTADGMPLVWMSRWRGQALVERVTGSDLLLPLATRAAREGWRLFLLGGVQGVAERAAREMKRRAPGLCVAGTASPRFAGTDPAAWVDAGLVATLRSAAPDILLVALGAPKQELWIDHHRAIGALEAPVAIGVGGSLDFLAGQQRRAPAWMQARGVEWLHRAATQPLRLAPRYARDLPTFAGLCLRELLR